MRRLVSKLICGLGAASILAALVSAGEVKISINDGSKQIENVVVALKPQFDSNIVQSMRDKPVMQQQGALFFPFVLPVGLGTTVTFPNLDEFRHHVYSFSKAKRFELRLYGQDESKQILFDQPGVVSLGCNIHDNMLAYIYVVDAPVYGKTNDAGSVSFADLPAGSYTVSVWHPDLKGKAAESFGDVTIADGAVEKAITLDLRKVRKKQEPPVEDDYS